MSRVDDILNLEQELNQETQSHLQLKADLSIKLAELSAEETTLTNQLTNLQEKLSSEGVKEKTLPSIDISQLIQTKDQLEAEIAQFQEELNPIEHQLAQLNSERSVIDSKIDVLLQEKSTQEKKSQELKQKQVKKQTSNKVHNDREKLRKLKNRIEEQKNIKDNLKEFVKTLETIQLVVSSYSPLAESKISLSSDVTEEIQNLIITSKKTFDEAQTKFDPNNLVPFLIDADKSYRNIISAFIELCDSISNTVLEAEFEEQILTLVNNGLMLNTRHLNAVQSMLAKLEKGVEIAPLASFSNEIKNYFVDNLTYLRITGWVVLEPPPS
jgi:chromosome segregation ATPase